MKNFEILTKLFNIIKSLTNIILDILISSSFLLFSSDSLLDKISLEKFRSNYKQWIGLAFLLSGASLIANLFVLIWKGGKNQFTYWKYLKNGKYYLKNLTIEEKRVLQ